MRTFRASLAVTLLSCMGLSLAGCMDMFDPSGGRYAQGRFVDPEAFALSDTRHSASDVTFVFTPKKPAGQIKLRSVFLFSHLAPEKRNGPHLKFDLNPAGQLVVSVKNEDVAKFTGLVIFGDYGAPKEAIPDAKSVNILQEVRFAR